MLFRKMLRDARQGLSDQFPYYASLIIALVSFYTLLSLQDQDVFRFLRHQEAEAIRKLNQVIGGIFVLSLFFLFFLVYFACHYQWDRRRKEMGLFLMMGMKKSQLFGLLMMENLLSGLVSLIVGLPLALFLTDLMSLLIGRALGLGLAYHRFSFSLQALGWTAVGFMLVQLLSTFFYLLKIARLDPQELMLSLAPKKQTLFPSPNNSRRLVLGIFLLLLAYAVGLWLLRSNPIYLLLIFLLGILGTFQFYQGLSARLSQRRTLKHASHPLSSFTQRQIQETVFFEHKSLAVSSLLLLMSTLSLVYGFGGAHIGSLDDVQRVDFSLEGNAQNLQTTLTEKSLAQKLQTPYLMQITSLSCDILPMDISALKEGIAALPESASQQSLLTELSSPRLYVFAVRSSSLRTLREQRGLSGPTLGPEQIALYSAFPQHKALLQKVLEKSSTPQQIFLDGNAYSLYPEAYMDPLFADRAMTLGLAFILPDALFDRLSPNPHHVWVNANLNESFQSEKGLLNALLEVQTIFDAKGLTYESYIGGMGRRMYYVVSGGYLGVYLGLLFFIIANTVLGLKYLIEHRNHKGRYELLLHLGATQEQIAHSVKREIYSFFGLCLGVAALNTGFGLAALLRSFLRLPEGAALPPFLLTAGVAFLGFAVLELVYIHLVVRTSQREIFRHSSPD